MKRYQPTMHRATFGLFAAAMTAFTIALVVVVPANMDVSAQQERLLAEACAPTQTLPEALAHAKQHG
jgi:hypothetical protein